MKLSDLTPEKLRLFKTEPMFKLGILLRYHRKNIDYGNENCMHSRALVKLYRTKQYKAYCRESKLGKPDTMGMMLCGCGY